ncbi:MAG: alpha/beta-hydrolase family protein [Acidimicrobiia bacterium]
MARRYANPLAGLITGVRFAVKSLEPSLMPRSAIDQGIIMGGSFLTGFLAGSTAGLIVTTAPIPGSGRALRIAGVLAASARSADSLRAHDPTAPPPVDESEAWAEVGSEVLSSLALAGIASKKAPPVTQVATLAAVAASTGIDAQGALELRSDTPDAAYLATSVGVAAALNAGVASLVGIVRLGGFGMRKMVRRTGVTGSAATLIGSIATIAALVVGVKAAAKVGLGKIAAGNRATEIAYATAPEPSSVSGSKFSLAAYETLGLQGRRLVSEVTSPEAIQEVMGVKPTHDPIRVYVGLGTADTEDDRIEVAIQELKRTGGFDRSLIIAASPAGTGYVNYIAAEAAELMALGDVATVAVQYGEVPSMLSITKVGDAARVYAALVTRLRAEVDALDRPIRIAAYGESLGAITCQMGVLEASESSTNLIVDDALWVGTPQGSELFEGLTSDGTPVFDQFDDVVAYLEAGSDVPDVFFLNHDNDPVTKFNLSIAYEMPEWLKTASRGRGMDPHQRWLPGIAFWQGLIDTKNAATVVPGEFFSTGHDYRADLAQFVRAAYGFSDTTDEQMVQIEARLRQSEIDRAANIDQGRLQTA